MILTPPQLEAEGVLREHIVSETRDPFILQAVSGSGKSILTRQVCQSLGIPMAVLSEFPHQEFDAVQRRDLALVDYRDPKQVLDIRSAVGERIRGMVLLAHPRFPKEDNRTTQLVDHRDELATAGIPSRVHVMRAMTQDESVIYAQERCKESLNETLIKLIRAFGLGNPGHIDALLRDPSFDFDRARFFSTVKVRQILSHANDWHRDPLSRVEAILGQRLSSDLASVVQDSNNGSLENRLAHLSVDPTMQFLLPKHAQTLDFYRELLDYSCRENCLAIELYVPEANDDVLKILGIEDERLENKGRILRFCGGFMKSRVITSRGHYGDFTTEESCRKEQWEPWLRGEKPQFIPAGGHPLYVGVYTHGGMSRMDNPMLPYAVETLLQGKGLSYTREVVRDNGVVDIYYHIDAEGDRLVSGENEK